MRTRVAAAALSLLAALPFAAIAQEPATVGPTIYRQTLDNERVRVFEVTFKKGAEIAMHSHPDHAVYVVQGGSLEITLADGTKNVIVAKPGEAFFLPAQAHSARNVGKGTIKVTVTELKERLNDVALGEYRRLRRRLGDLTPEQEDAILSVLLPSIINKISHPMIAHMRDSARRDGHADGGVSIWRRIFGLGGGEQ